LVLVGLALTVAPAPARAQPYTVPTSWGGDLSSRPRLTGDWGGLRDELGKKGVVLDVDVLVTPMDVMSGGRRTGAEPWGNVDYTLNVDTQKLGLWPGGFLKVSADTGFGTNLFAKSGALVPVNTATLLPGPNQRTTALTNATFMQFLSEQFGMVIGKFNLLEAGKQEFYGDYSTQFLNAAFVFPMTLEQVPLSAYGGGLIGLPTKDITLSVLAFDPNGTPTSNGFGNAFNNGTIVVGSGQVTIKPSGLVGLANLLSAQGYATGMWGKWHLGSAEERFPTCQGFDEWYGIPSLNL
jgi:porin